MNTLSEVMQRLKERGIPEFLFSEKGFTDDQTRYFGPHDLVIIKVYRFEGGSDPSDMSIVYVFETKDDTYGYSVNAYGVYDDQSATYDNFIREVREKDHGEQISFIL